MKIFFNLCFVLCFTLQNAFAFSTKSLSPSEIETVVNYVNDLKDAERIGLYEEFFRDRSPEDQKWFAANKEHFQKKVELSADGADVTFKIEGKVHTISDLNLAQGTIKFNGAVLNYKTLTMKNWEKFLTDHSAPRTSFYDGLFISNAYAELFTALAVIAGIMAITSFISGVMYVRGKAFKEEQAVLHMQSLKYQCLTATRNIHELDTPEKIAPVLAQMKSGSEEIGEMIKQKKSFTSGSIEIVFSETKDCLDELIGKLSKGPTPLPDEQARAVSQLKYLNSECQENTKELLAKEPDYNSIIAKFQFQIDSLGKIGKNMENFKFNGINKLIKQLEQCLSQSSVIISQTIQTPKAVTKSGSRNNSDRAVTKDAPISKQATKKSSATKQ